MNNNKNILIIGGGPAGLEAAIQLQKLNYNIILIEKSDHLGGHLAEWDRLFPDGVKTKEILDKLVNNLVGVKYFLNTEIDSINLLNGSYNAILSNGITILAKAVLIASGFDLFKAERKQEYGYGVYNHVISNADLESYFKDGKDQRVVKNPRRVGFVHCVGSRDEKVGNIHCSKVCCVTAVKQACEIKEKFPDAEVFCFYIDLRMFGRGYEDLYLKAQQKYGIRFIRGRVSEVAENIKNELIIKAEDTLSGKPIQVTLDLLVLMSGMMNSKSGLELGEMLSLNKKEDGFFECKSSIYSQQFSNKKGIFYAGTCTGPKTLPDTFHEARSAAMEINTYMNESNKE